MVGRLFDLKKKEQQNQKPEKPEAASMVGH
jgi:hypothetical protein